jgi:hypothetical protein
LFWTENENSSAKGYDRKKGVFGRTARVQTILSVCAIPKTDQTITGSISGQLLVWEGPFFLKLFVWERGGNNYLRLVKLLSEH